MMGCLAVLIWIVCFTLYAQQITRTLKQTSLQQPIQQDNISIIGVLRTSGLSDEEKQTFSLPNVDFQVIHLRDNNVSGYYLQTNTLTEEMLGSCIEVTGVIPAEWKNKDIKDTYNRSALDVSSIETIDRSICYPYSQLNTSEEIGEVAVLNGVITHRKRPAPDIGYDYELTLSAPFVDKLSSYGSPQTLHSVSVIPESDQVWITLEQNIGKKITIKGVMKWGYAESRYFNAIAIQ